MIEVDIAPADVLWTQINQHLWLNSLYYTDGHPRPLAGAPETPGQGHLVPLHLGHLVPLSRKVRAPGIRAFLAPGIQNIEMTL